MFRHVPGVGDIPPLGVITAYMAGYPFAFIKDLDGMGGRADFDLFSHIAVRNAVKMAFVQGYMIIEGHLGLFPVGAFIPAYRQPHEFMLFRLQKSTPAVSGQFLKGLGIKQFEFHLNRFP
jgi:hypothetical protein